MTDRVSTEWNGADVRKWLESRIVASRADQVAAERAGRGRQDDCDMSAAEEMVCTLLLGKNRTDDRKAFTEELRALLDRDEYIWRGVYDDSRFDRHARACLRRIVRMTKANDSFGKTGRYA